jgi:hypothetical protein
MKSLLTAVLFFPLLFLALIAETIRTIASGPLALAYGFCLFLSHKFSH